MDYFKFLPLEITLDISRLPTESAIECKTVCTNWRSVVAHPSFSKIHCHRHLNHSSSSEYAGKLGFLALTFHHGLHYFEYDDDNHDQSRRISFTLPIEDCRFVGSINGLICLLDRYQRHPSVYIYNPITRECVTLPEVKRDGDFEHENTSFGYISSTNKHKISRFYKLKTCLEVHIYTLGSGHGWRNLGKFTYGSEYQELEHSCFFANEALYWLDHDLEMIGTFDLAVEKFCEHSALPPLPPDSDWLPYYSLGVLDGFFSFVLEDDEDDRIKDIWLLKKKNQNHDKGEAEEHHPLGWTKEFRIVDTASNELLAITMRGGVLSKSCGNDINIYDTKTSTSKSLVKFKSNILDVVLHKNTLVSLKELGEEDAKVMGSAEMEETESSEESHEDESSGSGEQSQEDSDPEDIYL